MKIIIELDGKKYEFRKSYKGKKGLCDSCALVGVCQKTLKGIDIGGAVIAKMEYNKNRPYKHGKKF